MDAELWTFRKEVPAREIEGFDVEAHDGSIGKIDNEVGRSFVVVDTGRIFGRKVVIPARALETIDRDEQKVFVSMTKDQIRNFTRVRPGPRLGRRGLPNEARHLLRRPAARLLRSGRARCRGGGGAPRSPPASAPPGSGLRCGICTASQRRPYPWAMSPTDVSLSLLQQERYDGGLWHTSPHELRVVPLAGGTGVAVGFEDPGGTEAGSR